MKKCATIFGILFAVLLVCFAASVAATGVNENGFGVSVYGLNPIIGRLDGINTKLYNKDEEWVSNLAQSDTVTKIDLGIANAKTVIQTADVDWIEIYYKAGRTGIRFGAEIKNGTLYVREHAFFFMNFDFGNDSASVLEITLPEREYEKIELSAASGSIETQELIAKRFSAEIASGGANLSFFAEEIELSAASGTIIAENCTQNGENRKAKSISVDCASGNHTVRGFLTDKFDIDLASGNVTLEGISGKGDVDLASGNVCLDYAVWDNDLDIDAASGTVEARLPAESGAYVELDAASGGVTAELDGEKASFSRDSSGRVGGDNVHRVDIDLMSGKVRLLNRTAESAAE